jgi:hypothetical protein
MVGGSRGGGLVEKKEEEKMYGQQSATQIV